MSKILLVYNSLSGNTKKIADFIETALIEKGNLVIKKTMLECTATDIQQFDTIVLGTYTWGKGELPKTCRLFFQEMESTDFIGKSFAVFGSGDKSHEVFCGAVDLIESKLRNNNGQIITTSLKIELSPTDEDYLPCYQFVEQISQQLGN